MRIRLTTVDRGSRGRALVGIAAGLLALASSPVSSAWAVELPAKDVPTSMHGAVETQAVTVGNGALSLFVDPGTAYAYSTLDRDDYGEDSVSFTMTARGANLNLGTIAYAVIWAAPNCETRNAPCVLSGSLDKHMPNTGLHEAKGFPAYAEALYPPPPASDAESQERVYKCVVSKDGPGSPPTGGQAQRFCQDNPEVPLTAWAETIDDEYRATGFSRAAGFDLGVLGVRGSESKSDVQAVGEEKVRSTGYSNVSGISLLNGYVRIDNVFSEATIVSSGQGVDIKKSGVKCSFAGLTVAGEMFSEDAARVADPRLQAALNQVAAQTKVKVELIPPALQPLTQVDSGKFTTGCSGLVVKLTDLNQQSPVPCAPTAPPGAPNCVPAPGNREEISFGRISVQQSVNEFESFGSGDGLGLGEDVGGGDFADVGSGAAGDFSSGGSGAADFGGAGSDVSVGGGAGLGDVSVPAADDSSGGGSASSGGRSGGRSGAGADVGGQYAGATGVEEGLDLQSIGAMTAIGGAGLLFGFMVLIGVVNALASGRRFRLPGF